MPNIGPIELILILAIALIIFGPGKLPEVGASFGKTLREFRKASTDIQESASLTAPAPNTLSGKPATPNVYTSGESDAAAEAKDVSPRGTPADPVDDKA